MSKQKSTFLCGGVLFFMLRKATYPNGSARDHRDGIKDEHKAPDLMRDLIYTFSGSKCYGSKKDTSNYRECKSEGTGNVPFNDLSIISAYESTVKNRYREAVERMREFCHRHINPAMNEWLVRALLEVIEFDGEITDSDSFYVLGDGSCMDRAAIKKEGRYELEPFLVGVLYFILKYRYGKNSLGADTLDFYGDKKSYNERVHKGNAGQRITRKLNVMLYEPPADDNEADADNSEEPEEEMESEMIQEDVDTDDEESFFEETDEDIYDAPPEQNADNTIIIQYQTNVVQKGENNFNLTNNGVMNLDFGGGKK